MVILSREEDINLGSTRILRQINEGWGEADTEESSIPVVTVGAGSLDPPPAVGMLELLDIEQVLFVAGADEQEPLIAPYSVLYLWHTLMPVPARNHEDATLGVGISLDPIELQAGRVELVGEEKVKHCLVPLITRFEPTYGYHGFTPTIQAHST